jgi:hypothetical protein
MTLRASSDLGNRLYSRTTTQLGAFDVRIVGDRIVGFTYDPAAATEGSMFSSNPGNLTGFDLR